MIKKCKGCGKEEEHHGKGYCYNCYRKFSWKPKKAICKNCGREKHIHAKEVCPGCYTTIFRLQYNKDWNYKNRHNIDLITYKKITQKCFICDFDKIVDLHHLDENRENNSEENLIGLCPNHHKLIHMIEFKEEIIERLKEKGILINQKFVQSFT
ncbi:MAG: 60S ribosomal export protein NMD3 [Nanoarchaeota archaeon]|nr:60S ribosomal export protein NMD3 [Nanoarchaeota archaeon]